MSTCRYCHVITDSPDSLCSDRCRQEYFGFDSESNDERHAAGPEEDDPLESEED